MRPAAGLMHCLPDRLLVSLLLSAWTWPCTSVLQHPRAAQSRHLKAAVGEIKATQKQPGAVALSRSDNSTGVEVRFNPRDYNAAVGKVFAFYYSSTSGELATSVEARNYKGLEQPPSSEDPVYDPGSGTMVNRGDCPLRLISHVSLPSPQRKANLRLAELAVCETFWDNPCGGPVGCELEIMAPLPYSNDQEPYVGAAIALVAHSALCARRVGNGQRESCAIKRSTAAVSAGLRRSGDAIKLKPLPSYWVGMKLDACYSLGFPEAVFATGNRDDYLSSEHHERKTDVLAWPTTPPEVAFCEDLSCLGQKFER